MKQESKKNETDSSISLQMCKAYLGKKVKIIIDQPYGSYYKGIRYDLNYGFVPNTVAPDGEGLDAYYLNAKEPLNEVEGFCIAIVHRLEDDDDKLILVEEGVNFSNEEIEKLVNFSEQFHKHVIVRSF